MLQDLISELADTLTVEGMVDLGREMRDNMIFYDRDVLIQMCTGMVEGLMVSILLGACLTEPGQFEVIVTRLRMIIGQMPELLRSRTGQLDVDTFLDRFMETGGRTIYDSFPAVVATFHTYVKGRYDPGDDINRLLREARQHYEGGNAAGALAMLGQAGAVALRGAALRPVWVRLAGPMESWMHGVFLAAETARAHPDVVFPLDDVVAEQAKRTRGVIELALERRDRQGPIDEEPKENDVDQALAEIFAAGREPNRAHWDLLVAHGSELLPIWLSAAKTAELRQTQVPVFAIRMLAALRADEAAGTLLELAEELQVDDPLFVEVREALNSISPKSRSAVLHKVRHSDADKMAMVATCLLKGRREERVFDALTDLLRRTRSYRGKETVVDCLAAYGDSRALPLLREVLQDPEFGDGLKATVQGAIHRLSAEKKNAARSPRGRSKAKENV